MFDTAKNLRLTTTAQWMLLDIPGESWSRGYMPYDGHRKLTFL